MNVRLIALTQLYSVLDSPVPEWEWLRDLNGPADDLAEFAGRACYESWDRPNPRTATNQGYLANIIDHEHFSVLEHASASFYVTGVSRSLLMELRTHRHLSFSARSQRYVDETNAVFITPPAILALLDSMKTANEHEDMTITSWFTSEFQRTISRYETLVDLLLANGATRKEAREAARCVMPNATETRFVVTGNMRAWRDVLHKRTSSHADAEMQQLANEILRLLKHVAPNSFQDM
jgi:thymidylate synthase (FAD)